LLITTCIEKHCTRPLRGIWKQLFVHLQHVLTYPEFTRAVEITLTVHVTVIILRNAVAYPTKVALALK